MQEVTLFSGGGGLISTIGDYGRFGQMLVNGGELDGRRILEASTVELIMTNQIPGIKFREDTWMGLGGQVYKSSGEYSWTGMASTAFFADPDLDLVTLVFSQYVPYMKHPFAWEFHEMVRDAIVR
jgi:CubicO group peptidase (beta-lactamase class C family)